MTTLVARNVIRTTALALATLLAACTPKEDANMDSATALADSTARADSIARAGTLAGDTTAGGVRREFTTGELLWILNTANDGEIEAGKLAATKSTKAEVKTFAADIQKDHQAFKASVDSAAKALGATVAMPKENENLVEDHRKAMADLTGKANGEEFEKAFLDHEVTMHKRVIDEIEDSLERQDHPEMQALLQRALQAFRGHLERAEVIKRTY